MVRRSILIAKRHLEFLTEKELGKMKSEGVEVGKYKRMTMFVAV